MFKYFKNILISFLFLLSANSNVFGQVEKYQDFGLTLYGNINSNTHIKFDSYVVKEYINEPIYEYRYTFIIVNNSLSQAYPRNIYITGINIYVNNKNVSSEQYPKGFWAIAPSNTEFAFFYYKTNDKILNFSFSWTNIEYY